MVTSSTTKNKLSVVSPEASVTPDVAAPAEASEPAEAVLETQSAELIDENQEVIDLDSPEFYLNRELTWLEFNCRVLHEAVDESNPLLERLRFVGIVSANLDEFFMKRIGGLKQQVGAGILDYSVDGRLPAQQIEECYIKVRELEAEKEALIPGLIEKLAQQDIHITPFDALSKDKQAVIRNYYFDNIYPLVTPQGVDSAHPFPFISNLSLNLLVTLRHSDSEDEIRARVKVPVGLGIPRFLQVPDSHIFVPLESVMAHNLDLLFPKIANNKGLAYLFERSGTNWSESAWLVPAALGGLAGFDVALSDSQALVGAPAEGWHGRVYTYSLGSGFTRYCPSTANSTGVPARIDISGSTSISENQFGLTGSSLPRNTFALAIYGETAAKFPLGDGLLCISPFFPGLVRLPVVQVLGNGSVDVPIDFPDLPAHAQITAGSRWNFQLWYRDAVIGGTGSNLSDALNVTFTP